MISLFEHIKNAASTGDYRSVGALIGLMIAKKNVEYGDSIPRASACLSILYPEGIATDQYRQAVAISRVIEKLSRISAGNLGDEDAWLDVAGYGIMMLVGRRPQ